VNGKQEKFLDYVTCTMKDWCFAMDSEFTYLATVRGDEPHLFNHRKDPGATINLAADNPSIVRRMIDLLEKDAGGTLPNLRPRDGKWIY